MKKVLEDGSLGVTKYDEFIVPQSFNANLNCTGSDEDLYQSNGNENYFDGF